MSPYTHLRRSSGEFLVAVQFLTRIPVPAQPYEEDSLARSVKFFPVVGVVVAAGSVLLHLLLTPHLPRPVTALFIILYQVLITGGLHEDGLADVADGFGGGTNREKILLILRDSRIGSYGGMALVFSVVGRVALIASLPLAMVPYYLIAANVLSRWTTLPLSYFLPSARGRDAVSAEGQGVRIARLTSKESLVFGTVFSFALAAVLLRTHAPSCILGVTGLAWLTGTHYMRRIGGITGDCFGATIQLAEMSVYLCGAWTR